MLDKGASSPGPDNLYWARAHARQEVKSMGEGKASVE